MHFVISFLNLFAQIFAGKKSDNLSSVTTETPIEKAAMLGEAFNNRVGGNRK